MFYINFLIYLCYFFKHFKQFFNLLVFNFFNKKFHFFIYFVIIFWLNFKSKDLMLCYFLFCYKKQILHKKFLFVFSILTRLILLLLFLQLYIFFKISTHTFIQNALASFGKFCVSSEQIKGEPKKDPLNVRDATSTLR